MPNDNIQPCECGYLDREASDPDSPIQFDRELNEYYFAHQITHDGGTQAKGKLSLYHCPFCGGRAPESRRDDLFHRLTEAERQRLMRITKDLKTVQEVVSAFGEPDIRQHSGMVIIKPGRADEPECSQSYPVMIYKGLSEVSDVDVIVYPDDKVGITLRSKPLKTEG